MTFISTCIIVIIMEYIRIRKPRHPNSCKDGRIKRCRFIVSKHLGRPLKTNEFVHHINGIKTDDRLENLEILSPQKHMSIHVKGNKNPSAKITQEIADKIKTYKGVLSSRKIAPIFNISPSQVKRILSGFHWS